MTTTDWLIDIALILIVVRQMREERLTWRFVAIPVAIVYFVAKNYLHTLPTAGNDVALIAGCLALGSLLGLAGGLLTRVRGENGNAFIQAGPAAASLWIASMTARLGFIVWITHSSGEATLARFSIAHHITGADVWQTALVLLALSEVIVRIGTVVVRALLARNAAPETADVPVLAKVAA
jgi:hypothetical protein